MLGDRPGGAVSTASASSAPTRRASVGARRTSNYDAHRTGMQLGGGSCGVSAHALHDIIVRATYMLGACAQLLLRTCARCIVLLLSACDRDDGQRRVQVVTLPRVDIEHGARQIWRAGAGSRRRYARVSSVSAAADALGTGGGAGAGRVPCGGARTAAVLTCFSRVRARTLLQRLCASVSLCTRARPNSKRHAQRPSAAARWEPAPAYSSIHCLYEFWELRTHLLGVRVSDASQNPTSS
jgi:hypothetical protein